MSAAEPAVRLSIRHTPVFRDGMWKGLEPGDRIALWLAFHPTVVDPVCGHPRPAAETGGARERPWFCSQACRDAYRAHPERYRLTGRLEGRYRVTFRDLASHDAVLTIPVVFGSTKGQAHEHH